MGETKEIIDRLQDNALACSELIKIFIQSAQAFTIGLKTLGKHELKEAATYIELINLNYRLIMMLIQKIEKQEGKNE